VRDEGDLKKRKKGERTLDLNNHLATKGKVKKGKKGKRELRSGGERTSTTIPFEEKKKKKKGSSVRRERKKKQDIPRHVVEKKREKAQSKGEGGGEGVAY